MTVSIQHSETKEIIIVEVIGSRGTWLIAGDGYLYDMKHWRKIDG